MTPENADFVKKDGIFAVAKILRKEWNAVLMIAFHKVMKLVWHC